MNFQEMKYFVTVLYFFDLMDVAAGKLRMSSLRVPIWLVIHKSFPE